MTIKMIDRFLEVFIPLFIIVNPASTLALFSVITNRSSKKERINTAKNASIYAAILLIIFAVAGSSILAYLGIEIYSLRIAAYIEAFLAVLARSFLELLLVITEKRARVDAGFTMINKGMNTSRNLSIMLIVI